MYFRLPCECGKEVTVSEGAAGVSLPCACGREVLVPDLAELRRRAASEDLPWSPYREGEGPRQRHDTFGHKLFVAGSGVFLLGVGLFLGKISGLFPTFSSADELTAAAGIAIMAFAARAMADQEYREQADKEDAAR